MDERKRALEAVQVALPVFQQINELYSAADGIVQRASLHDANADGKAKGSKGKAFAFAFVTWLAFDLVLPLYAKIFASISGLFLVAYVVAAIVCCVIVYRKVIRSTQKNIEKETEALIDQSKYELDCISNDIYSIYQENEDVITLIPRDYRTYDAVCYFEHLLENGHADSMKEALILYDEYLHRQSMRIENQRMIQQNIQQREMLARVEQIANAAARDARVASTFSIASYLAVSDRQ